MANPEVCPKCGAEFDHEGVLWGSFECDSSIGSDPNESDYGEFEQSPKCKDRQIAQLQARVEKLERVAKAAKVLNCYGQYSTDRAWADLLAALKDLEVPNVS